MAPVIIQVATDTCRYYNPAYLSYQVYTSCIYQLINHPPPSPSPVSPATQLSQSKHIDPYTHLLFMIYPHLAISLQEHTHDQEAAEQEWLIPGNTYLLVLSIPHIL